MRTVQSDILFLTTEFSDPQVAELQLELKTAIDLTPGQVQQLEEVTAKAEKQARHLAIVQKCLSALHCHNWLQFPQVEGMLSSQTEVLTSPQIAKLANWAKVNTSVIDTLNISAVEGQQQAVNAREAALEFMFKPAK